jgi:hypothetical protein
LGVPHIRPHSSRITFRREYARILTHKTFESAAYRNYGLIEVCEHACYKTRSGLEACRYSQINRAMMDVVLCDLGSVTEEGRKESSGSKQWKAKGKPAGCILHICRFTKKGEHAATPDGGEHSTPPEQHSHTFHALLEEGNITLQGMHGTVLSIRLSVLSHVCMRIQPHGHAQPTLYITKHTRSHYAFSSTQIVHQQQHANMPHGQDSHRQANHRKQTPHKSTPRIHP